MGFARVEEDRRRNPVAQPYVEKAIRTKSEHAAVVVGKRLLHF